MGAFGAVRVERGDLHADAGDGLLLLFGFGEGQLLERGCGGTIPGGARRGGRLGAGEHGLGEESELSGGGRAGGEGDRAGNPVVSVVDAQVAELAGGEQVDLSHVFGGVVEVGGGEADHGSGVGAISSWTAGQRPPGCAKPHWPVHSQRPPARPYEPDPGADLGPVARVAVQVLGTDGHGRVTRRQRPGAARTPRSVRPARPGQRRCRPRPPLRSTPAPHRSPLRRTSRDTARTAR